MKNRKYIRALFTFPGFVASARLVGVFGDRFAWVIKPFNYKEKGRIHDNKNAKTWLKRRAL